MKKKPHLAILAISCSLPAFAAGWHFHTGRQSLTEKPVRQVIEAIESAAVTTSISAERDLQAAAIFDSLHGRTVASFVETLGSFGIGRIVKVEDIRHSDLWTLHPGREDGFEVSLIGLDRETPTRFQRVPPAMDAKSALSRLDLLSGTDHSRNAAAENERVPLDSLDHAGIDRLKESGDQKRAIFSRHDSIVAFGPIRSNQTCLRCHDGDAGDLLGIFRYTFPIPAQNLWLAGNP